MVKIIAMGLEQKFWEGFFRNLRTVISEKSFAAMAFTSPQELEFLESVYVPTKWERERPDFLLCGTINNGSALERPKVLHHLPVFPPTGTTKILVLDTLEKGLRNLLTTYGSLQIKMENGSVFSLTDASCLVRSFPEKFPRISAHDHVSQVRIKNSDGSSKDMRVLDFPPGTLLGFGEIESLLRGTQQMRPKDWLRDVARAYGLKRSPAAVGLLRDQKGLFLFPGIPFQKIHGLHIDGITFSHVIERKHLTVDIPQFADFLGAVNDISETRESTYHDHIRRLRKAELLTEIPIICGGSTPVLRETMALLLGRRGYQKSFSLNTLEQGLLKEPSLILKVDGWATKGNGVQLYEPLLMDISANLSEALKPLDRLLEWRLLAFRAPPPKLPKVTEEDFALRKKRLLARIRRATKAISEGKRREAPLRQEVQVQEAARTKLDELLEAEDTIQVWDGDLPEGIQQVLLLSHDKEEAGAVMQSLKQIHKKRWFDLSPFTTADMVQNLSLEEVQHYGKNGVMLITSASRDRLSTLRETIENQLPLARQGVAKCEADLEKQHVNESVAAQGLEDLAREWLWQSLDHWIAKHENQIFKLLDSLRDRHERRWLNRSLVHRVLVFPSIQDNTEPLLEVCAELFPSFNRNLSTVSPYEFEFENELPEAEIALVKKKAEEDRASPKALEGRMSRELLKRNEALFSDFLQVIAGELAGVRADLIILEHRPEIATRILTHLRGAVPTLKQVPAVLVLSEDWAPAPGKPLPWQFTRIAIYRRMGLLSPSECAQHLRPLFPQ